MNDYSHRFKLYEKVKVRSNEPSLAPVNGELGAVLGRSIQSDSTIAIYTIHIYSSEECWMVNEKDLESTGNFDVRESFYSGESIRVTRNGQLLK